MVPVVFAQAAAEYGLAATIGAKFVYWYSQAEMSLRNDPGAWAIGGVVLLGAVWLLRRA
jgi:hypothetical protein